MNPTIGVPWRGGDRWRDRTWRYVRAHLEQTGIPVTTADDGSELFSRAGSRNALVERAEGVVILHDADMVAPLDAYPAMAELAERTGRMVVGYTQYRALDQLTTLAVLDDLLDPFAAQPLGVTDAWSLGGIVAITVDAWREVGGMDTRFRGWGAEDWAFAHAASVVLGPIERVPTPAVHLWHPHGSGTHPELEKANAALLDAYTAATTLDELRHVQGGVMR